MGSVGKTRPAGHRNFVSFKNYLQSEREAHLVYEYKHLIISLCYVADVFSSSEADRDGV